MTETKYEYAGFRYILVLNDQGKAISAVAEFPQHPASMKEKHLRAAVDCYNQDHGKR